MDSSTGSEASLEARRRQQAVVAELGDRAVETDDLDELLRDATAAVADALGVTYCEALERRPGEGEALVRQGTGWRDGFVGDATVPADGDSLAGLAVHTGEPVIVEDLDATERFAVPAYLECHDVTSGVCVAVGPATEPWGVLGAYATEPREFSEHDATFLRSVAAVLASTVENRRARGEPAEAYGRVSDAVFALDGDWHFTYLNERAREVLGPDGEPLDGRPVWEVLPDDVAETVHAHFERAMREQKSVAFDVHYPAPADAWFEVRAYPSASGLSAYLRDVTDRRQARRQLEEERDVFAQGPTTVFRWTPEEGWPVEYVSENVEELLGYGPAAFESGEVLYEEVLLDEEVDRIAREVEENSDRSTERFSHEPYRVETKDGDVRWVKDTTKIVRDESGEITSYLGYLVDITERRERERALSQYEAIVETVNDGVYVVDGDGRFVMVNDAYAEMTGYDREELLGAHVSLVVAEDVTERAQEVEAAMRAGDTEAATIEAELLRADGERLPAEATFAMLPESDDGDVRRVGVVRDVSERKARERELQRFETLFMESTDVNAVLGTDGTFQYLPPSVEHVLGYESDELVGENAFDRIHPDDHDRIVAEFEGMVEDPEYRPTNEFRYRHADGHWVWLEATGRNLLDDPAVEGFVAYTRDVTERRRRERELEESERRYRTLAEYFPNGIVTLFDHDLEYQLAAGQGFEDIPVAPADAEGKYFADVWDEETAEALRPIFEAALAGEERSVELAYGGREWVVHGVPIADEAGEVFAGMTMAQDITERKERERQLRERERRLRRQRQFTDDILDAIDDVFYVIDEDGGLQRWNQSLADVSGYATEEIAALAPADFFAEADREAVAAAVREGFESGTVNVELDLVTRDGEAVPFEFNASTLEDPRGNTVLAGIGRDVTERVERERALEESERRYRTLVEHFPDGAVGLFDENLEYTAIGGQLMDEVGVSMDERVGQRVSEIYPEDLVEEVEPHFHAALEGEATAFETEFHDRYLFAHTLPVRDADDEVIAGMLVVQDVTERREYERRLEESNERLKQFAYAASHDLQEPLRMVSSYLQLVDRRYADALDEDGREFIEFAVDGADRMREMIEGLLQYSRVDTRGEPFEPVDLDDVLADVREDLQVKIEESDAEITAGSLPTVEGDAGQLRQVVQNLLDNAIEYSGDEPPVVEVSAERRGDEWVVAVADEGVGIDPDDQNQIFRVFQRLHSQADDGGTGIGLALCERVVERHGGDIWVESDLGEGATFRFTLRAADGAD